MTSTVSISTIVFSDHFRHIYAYNSGAPWVPQIWWAGHVSLSHMPHFLTSSLCTFESSVLCYSPSYVLNSCQQCPENICKTYYFSFLLLKSILSSLNFTVTSHPPPPVGPLPLHSIQSNPINKSVYVTPLLRISLLLLSTSESDLSSDSALKGTLWLCLSYLTCTHFTLTLLPLSAP